MISKKFIEDLKLSLEIVWILCSVIISGIILMTFFLPETLLNESPVCISKSEFETECFMCGMTRAYSEISEGNFYEAVLLNNISLHLFYFLYSEFIVFYLLPFKKNKKIDKIKKICYKFSKTKN